MPSLSFLYPNSVEPKTYYTTEFSVYGGTKAPPYESKEITATICAAAEGFTFEGVTNPRYGQSPQERGIHKGGEDVEVQENAACSLFPERDPLPLMRRFFGSFLADAGKK